VYQRHTKSQTLLCTIYRYHVIQHRSHIGPLSSLSLEGSLPAMAGGPWKALTTNPFVGCHSKPCREVLNTRVILDSQKACHGLKCSIPTATGGTLKVRKVNACLVCHPDPCQNLLDTKSMEMTPKGHLGQWGSLIAVLATPTMC
jgi:hypothetical protein